MRYLPRLLLASVCALLGNPATAVTLIDDARVIHVRTFGGGGVDLTENPAAPFAPFDSTVASDPNFGVFYEASQTSAATTASISGTGAVYGEFNGEGWSRLSIGFEVLQATPVAFDASVSHAAPSLHCFGSGSAALSGPGTLLSVQARGGGCGLASDALSVVTVLDPGLYNVSADATVGMDGISGSFDFDLTFVFPCGSEPCPTCDDGFDNDGNGFCDLPGSTCLDGSTPGDPGCTSPSQDGDGPACNDRVDNDGDGHIDYPDDPGCASPTSEIEDPQCDDQLDNDGDGRCDGIGSVCSDGSTPGDRDCLVRFRDTELPVCSDGRDNDGDGLVDLADPQCANGAQRSETWATCGLGWELVLVLPLVVLARQRRRASRQALR